jgi:hypothetical protein
MATTERNGAVGPLLLRPGLKSSTNEQTGAPRAARCSPERGLRVASRNVQVDISRQEFAEPPIGKKRRGSSAEPADDMSEARRLSEASTPKSPEKTLIRMPSPEFSRRVSPPRLQTTTRTTQQTSLSPVRCRRPSITTDASLLPARIFRNASIEDLDKFKALEVQESHTCDLQPSSDGPQRLGDVNALEVKGPRTSPRTRSRSLHLEDQQPSSLAVQAPLSRSRSRSMFAEATLSLLPMIAEPTSPTASPMFVE